MWCLVSPTGDVYNLIPGKVHTVSRKAGDIILANDQSVSRKHAYLEVRSPAADGVSIWDDTSKYGTYVNQGITYGTKLNSNIKATIKEGARVRFGLQEMNIWTLKRELLCVCAHMLKNTEKTKIGSILSQFDCKLVNNWTEDSTHLTTNSLCLTNEVMCALACGKPIVSPKYWDDFALMMTGKGASVDPTKFIPPLEDNRLQGKDYSCLPNPARKTIFKGKLFIFPTSQSLKAYKHVIETAGGKTGKLSDCGMSLEDYCKPHVVILSGVENVQSSFYNRVLSRLIMSNRRVIPEEDIGLALWKVSTDVHCNPLYCPNSILLKTPEILPDKATGKTLVMNTEDIDAAATGIELTNRVIPPTYSENLFATEEKTLSLSFRTGQLNSPLVPEAGAPRKRNRSSSTERVDVEHKRSRINSSAIKNEPPEEEDLFAVEDEILRPSISNTNFHLTNSSFAKRGMKPTASRDKEEDAFFFPSPPKTKNVKKFVEADDSYMFDLPEPPPPQQASSDEDDTDKFDFLDAKKFNKLTKTVKHNVQNESRNLSEAMWDLNSTSSTRGKRKEIEGADSEHLPSKKVLKACTDVTNVHSTGNTVRPSTGFISINKSSSIQKEMDLLKQEEEGMEPGKQEEMELSMHLTAKVVITSLIKNPQQKRGRNITSANDTALSGQNFKKFRKIWGPTTKRNIIRATKSNTKSSRDSLDSDEEGNAFLPNKPTSTHSRVQQSSIDEDNEFALPSMSQFM